MTTPDTMLLVSFGAAILAAAGLTVTVLAERDRKRGARDASCATTECVSVLRTPRATLFAALPNTWLGAIWYALLLTWALCGIAFGTTPSWDALMLLAAALVLAVSLFLLWTLLVTLRQSCRLCLAAHAINAAVFLLLFFGT
ncbi:MAG TPA: vitamin K epoxide reductase family protein [Bacteroidota bacterium]|nr:vitamin K epoxide reductase family protein [Bacteroidota bacterium]